MTERPRLAVVESDVHKPKPYKCSLCGAEVPDLPMPVLKHQLSHVKRRPYARDQPERERPSEQPDERIDEV